MDPITFDATAAAAWLRQPSADLAQFSRADYLGIDDDLFRRDAEGFLSAVADLLPDIAGLAAGADITDICLWLIPDGEILAQGAIITVDLTDGTRLASRYQALKDFADRDERGIDAAVSAIGHVAAQACQLLQTYQAAHPGYRPTSPQGRP